MITSGKRIAETASSLKKNTSDGLGLWAIKEFCQCAPEDLDKLAELLMEWDLAITAPAQWLVNLMALIPKKKGHRTVATMESGYRVYTGLDEVDGRQLKIENSHEDDSSKPNVSCLRAAEEDSWNRKS